MTEEIHIAYGSSNTIVDQLLVSICSVLKTNAMNKLFFHIIEYEISRENRKRIETIVGQYHNAAVEFIDCIEFCRELNVKAGYIITSWSKLCLYHLPLDKILYLDCDTTVEAPLNELWEIEFDRELLAGVQDDASLRWRVAVGLGESDDYINGGMVLMNLRSWRNDKVYLAVCDMLDRYKGNVPFSDQGVINSVCKGRIKGISPKYDMMGYVYGYRYEEICLLLNRRFCTRDEFEEARKRPVIIHWVSGPFNRPWFKECTHPEKERYVRLYSEVTDGMPLKAHKLPLKSRLIYRMYKLLPFGLFLFLQRMSDACKRRLM